MAWTQTKQGARVPLKCASAMGAYLPIQFLQGGSSLTETVIQAATYNVPQFGLSAATVINPGDPIEIWQPHDVGKGIAGASMGAGALVGVGSTNGVLGLVTAVAAGPTGPPKFALGWLMQNAAVGDEVSVYIDPKQIL